MLLLPAVLSASVALAQSPLDIFHRRLEGGATFYTEAEAAALKAAAGNSDPELRWQAVYAVSRWAEPRLADVLAKAQADADSRVRLFAVRALGKLSGVPEAARLSDPDLYVRAEAVSAFAAAKAFDKLPLSLFEDPSAHVRAAAANAAAASGDGSRFGPPLARLAASSGTMAPGQALLALAKLEGAAARPALERALKDPRWWLRARAYEAAGLLPEAGKLLESGLRDPDPRVASQALETLAASSSAAVVPALYRALTDEGSPLEMRGTAADVAAERKDPALVLALLAALPDAVGPGAGEYRSSLTKALRASVRPGTTEAALVEAALKDFPPFLDSPRTLKPLNAPPSVVFETEKGGFVVRLSTEAPNHAAAFVESVTSGLYDGTQWHRVVTAFVVQGGDPRGSGWGDAGWRLADEKTAAPFLRGTVGMPKAGPDTGGCQLFVSLVPTPHLDGRYTAFGRVTQGLEVLDRLEPGDKILKATLRR
ncbi:hypothetical protein EPO15_01145 [bacterium]|nr:MAG: hypothetical protein EPO15_01145 [bacterium]